MLSLFSFKHNKKVPFLFALVVMTYIPIYTYALTPFQANYQFLYNEKNMGVATRTLHKTDHENWTYNFNVNAGAIAAANESSIFNLEKNQVSSIRFSRNSRILFQNNPLNIQFLPRENQIKTQKATQENAFPWQPTALDELNVEIQVREDLQTSGLKDNYLIADAKGLGSKKFIKLGNEFVTTPYGTFATIKISLEQNRPEKNTTFWLAPKLDYAPVKVMHNDGFNSYALLMTSYKNLSQ